MGYPYLARIEVTNFRNLATFSVDLHPNAVFLGENRSGKSNLLHAIRLVLDPSLPDSARTLRAEDFWDGLPAPFGGARIKIRVYIRGFEGDPKVEACLSDCVVTADPLTAALTYEFRPRSSVPEGAGTPSVAERYEFTVYGGNDEANRVGPDVRNWLGLTVLPALRDAEEYIQPGRRSLLRPLLDRAGLAMAPEILSTVSEQIGAATDRLLEDESLGRLQARVNERLKEIFGPDQTVATRLAFATADPMQLLRTLRLYLQEGKARSIGDTSLGTSNVLFLSLLLQDLDERLADGTVAGSILAIEEPEAHLHPQLQRLLFRYSLRRDGCVLVTSHSPHIVSVAPLEAIVVLRAHGEGSTAHTVHGLALSRPLIADLERYLDVTRAEMLFARGIIFVEGMAEQYLVPAFAKHILKHAGLGDSLDQHGITVCAVGGTDFSPYWTVTGERGWSIPRVVITDGDPRKTGGERRIGMNRGARLIGFDPLGDTPSAEEVSALDEALSKAGVFVGPTDLELDLLPQIGDLMKAVFADIRGSTIAATRFAADVDRALENDQEARLSVISRLEDIGKGRFAQSCANHITAAHEPPAYIRDAILRIVTMVRSDA